MRILVFYLFLSFVFISKIFAQDNVIEISHQYNEDKTVDISYIKHLPGNYYLELTFKKLENCRNSGFKGVVKGRAGKLLRLKPLDEKKGIQFSYRYNYIYGTPNPKINRDFLYVLPFKSGKTIDIVETTDIREMAHESKKEKTWKSFLVRRSSADTVCSMRKGIVIKIVAKYNENRSDDYNYTSKMNTITIEHKDGTFSKYRGFNKDLIFVKLGQTVYPQTPLGVLYRFDNSSYRLYFDVTYRKPVNDSFFKQRTFTDEILLAFLNPYFYTKDGVVKLNHSQKYTVDINNDIYFKEFSRRERRKYKKHPERFK